MTYLNSGVGHRVPSGKGCLFVELGTILRLLSYQKPLTLLQSHTDTTTFCSGNKGHNILSLDMELRIRYLDSLWVFWKI